MKLSFKKHPQNTGLNAIGNPYSQVDIKVDGKKIGLIVPPSWNSKNQNWIVQIAVIKENINEDKNPNCPWKWVKLKTEFKTEDEARKYLKKNKDAIFSILNVHYFEE